MQSRVTTAMIYGSLMSSLQDNLRQVVDLQRQLSTRQKYTKLADNPEVISRSMVLDSSLRANVAYQNANENALTMLKHSESALNKVLNAAQTIRTLVIQAGNGALGADELQGIADQIQANKDEILDALNTRVAGKYLFGGTDTGTKPFVVDPNGRIRYQGSDERIRYELEEGVLADISFAGNEVMGSKEKGHFICSHEVPLDWLWTGREEKVQITVGNRTLAVFIPEQWVDEVATGRTKPTDYNRFRDPDEVRGITLDDLAMLVNRSLKEQGADMLVNAVVEKDLATNTQRMVLRSNTGDSVGITGWPDTDYLPMAQSIAGVAFPKTGTTATNDLAVELPNWNHSLLVGGGEAKLTNLSGKVLTVVAGGNRTSHTFAANPADKDALLAELNTAGVLPANVTAKFQGDSLALVSSAGDALRVDGAAAQELFGSVNASEKAKYSGLMGVVNVLGWRDDTLGKGMRVTVGADVFDFSFAGKHSITDLVQEINQRIPVDAGDVPVASLNAGRLVLQSTKGAVKVEDFGTAGGVQQMLGYASGVESSTSSVTVQLGESHPVKVYMNKGDDLTKVADKINAIEGIYARTSADKDQLVVVAQRTGLLPKDPLAVDAAKEKMHYPSVTIKGEGMGMTLFDYRFSTDPQTNKETGLVASKEAVRPVDHSHMDVFDYLGMETALKSVEFSPGQTLKVGTYDPATNTWSGAPLHWRVSSGAHVADVKLNPGEYTMEQLAGRLKNAGTGWLDATVDVFRLPGYYSADDHEKGQGTSYNNENETSRLVLRANGGQPLVFMDMNDQHYADEMGLSTAVRVDPNMGVSDVRFPSAPCVDDALGVRLRVQLTCGKFFDVRLPQNEVTDPATGKIDRVKVMRQIADQVNAQEGDELMQVTIPVDNYGKPIPESASLHARSGASFSIVDLPISDPAWELYSGGIAAQLGIHSGVTSNLGALSGAGAAGMKDDETMGVTGTIRFESLGRKVEVDVSAEDTVKDVMDRLRSQAGDWLYVNYFDATMGMRKGQQGDHPIISIAAKDGAAVSVVDVQGTVSQDKLRLATGARSTGSFLGADGELDPAKFWDEGEVPPATYSISVAGYTHTIDLTAMRDVNGNGKMDIMDLIGTINARMQDDDIRAELTKDGHLSLWSPRGYVFKAYSTQLDAQGNVPATPAPFAKLSDTLTTAYRGGYRLDSADRAAPGIFTQNVTVRSGSNERQQNAFDLLDDVLAAVRSENREALSEVMIPRIDRFIDGVLKVMSTNGALQNRYTNNKERLMSENTIMTDSYQDMMMIDPEKIPTDLMMAKFMHEASLSVISKIIQPTLLDFLR